jgi:hypothetical protein
MPPLRQQKRQERQETHAYAGVEDSDTKQQCEAAARAGGAMGGFRFGSERPQVRRQEDRDRRRNVASTG